MIREIAQQIPRRASGLELIVLGVRRGLRRLGDVRLEAAEVGALIVVERGDRRSAGADGRGGEVLAWSEPGDAVVDQLLGDVAQALVEPDILEIVRLGDVDPAPG